MTYTKTINGQQKFSDCRTIELNGVWISNPSAEQIAEAGWVEYIPPEVIPTPQTEPDYEQVMQAVKNMLSTSVENLSDEEALQVAALYPTWASKAGEQVNVGERYWYDGNLYKVIQAHTIQEDWTPDVSTSLFTEVSIEEWPDWIQPTGAQDAYMTGDKVTHNDKHWVSDVDNNVWEPSVYGWTEQ